MIEYEQVIKYFIWFLLGIIFGVVYPYIDAYLEGLFTKKNKKKGK